MTAKHIHTVEYLSSPSSYLSINGETLPASGESAMEDLGDIEDADTSRRPAIETGSAAAPLLPEGTIGATSSAIKVFVEEEEVEALEFSAEEEEVTRG